MKKLVRNKVPDLIKKSNRTPVTRVLQMEEFRNALKEKIFEEVEEFFTADDQRQRVEEMADILEVLKSLCETHAIFIGEVINVAKNKREKRGDFSEKIFLEGIDDGLKKVEGETDATRSISKDDKKDD